MPLSPLQQSPNTLTLPSSNDDELDAKISLKPLHYLGQSIRRCMLGLRPRLRARNSLWDLVTKHPADLYPTSHLQLHWQQPVEEGLDGLPPLPISPTSPSHPVAILKLDEEASVEQHISPDMAPVRSSVSIIMAAQVLLITFTAILEARFEAVTRRSRRRAVWYV